MVLSVGDGHDSCKPKLAGHALACQSPNVKRSGPRAIGAQTLLCTRAVLDANCIRGLDEDKLAALASGRVVAVLHGQADRRSRPKASAE